jgi:hypothetical protein
VSCFFSKLATGLAGGRLVNASVSVDSAITLFVATAVVSWPTIKTSLDLFSSSAFALLLLRSPSFLAIWSSEFLFPDEVQITALTIRTAIPTAPNASRDQKPLKVDHQLPSL